MKALRLMLALPLVMVSVVLMLLAHSIGGKQ